MDQLRRGYQLSVHNSRGVHIVDPTGAPERELARVYNGKAEAVENAGFHRLAVTCRAIADSYNREAERCVAEHEAQTRLRDDGETDC